MNLSWQISFADLFDLIQPALFAVAALISAWVFADARRRSFRLYEVALWTLGALLLPHIMLPLYLLARMFRRRLDTPAASAIEADGEVAAAPADVADVAPTGAAAVSAADERAAIVRLADEELAPYAESLPDNSSSLAVASSKSRPRRRRIWPALYLLMTLALGALYFYSDYTSADAHLARASHALVRGERERAISEYRAALRRADDPHTRKLLGIQLAEAARWEEALREFRAAEHGGDPDATLPFRLAVALEALNRPSAARPFYQRFLDGQACAAAPPDPRCAQAQERLQSRGAGVPP